MRTEELTEVKVPLKTWAKITALLNFIEDLDIKCRSVLAPLDEVDFVSDEAKDLLRELRNEK